VDIHSKLNGGPNIVRLLDIIGDYDGASLILEFIETDPPADRYQSLDLSSIQKTFTEY
jgi:hypothetical protein